jgi:hypothetical protein
VTKKKEKRRAGSAKTSLSVLYFRIQGQFCHVPWVNFALLFCVVIIALVCQVLFGSRERDWARECAGIAV